MRATYFCKMKKKGNSLCVVVPKEIRTICEIKEGDYVRVEINRMDVKTDDNLHDNDTARSSPEARNKGIHQEE